MANDPVISVQNLGIGFDNLIVQQSIDFDVYPGEILAILGGSGSGKSTLLKSMLGLNKPLKGDILIDGDSIAMAREHDQIYKRILGKIGVTYQGIAFLGSLTIAENVALPYEEHTDLSREEISTLVCIKLGLVNLCGFEHYLPSEISGGMKKRAAIARAIALDPKILFLDEPSAGLDPVLSAEIDNLLTRINREMNISMVIVTHELSSIFRIADRIIVLDNKGNGILDQGPPSRLAQESKNEYVQKFLNIQN
ncbi:MAG: ABC transporter ATP-binding protein [Thermodesulfobacteriota bacterium]